MKNKLRSLILLVAGTFIFSFSNGMAGECHNLPDSSYAPVAGTALMRGAGVSDASAINDIQAYQMLPVNIQNMLVANHISIYEINPSTGDAINAEIPSAAGINGKVAGVARAPEYKILKYRDGRRVVNVAKYGYIDLDTAAEAKYGEDKLISLLHEVGHQIDHLYLGGYPAVGSYFVASSQVEWQTIYAAEKNKLASYSAASACNVYTAAEMFAESAGIYFANPTWLQNNCPFTFAYMAKVVGSFT